MLPSLYKMIISKLFEMINFPNKKRINSRNIIELNNILIQLFYYCIRGLVISIPSV